MWLVQKKISIAVICFVMLSVVMIGCQQERGESAISKESIVIYPSGPDFIKSIIGQRGSVEITREMREKFNLFARDYKWVYLPDMNYYESFFEANEYAESFGHNNFGFAAFYVLQYMDCPEQMSADAMQLAIQSLFAAKESYQDMPHQNYGRLANFEGGYYSPPREGGLYHERMFYLLTGLEVVQEGSNDIYITARAQSYYFNHPSYKPGENEKWLDAKAKEMGISDMQAAAQLLASGEMAELQDGSEYETKMHIKLDRQKPDSYAPQFVSSYSRSINEKG